MSMAKLLIEKDWLLSATWINSPCSVMMRPKCKLLQGWSKMWCGQQRKHWKGKRSSFKQRLRSEGWEKILCVLTSPFGPYKWQGTAEWPWHCDCSASLRWGEVQGWAAALGKQEQTVLVPELHASFISLPAGQGMLCFACRAMQCGAWHMNLHGGIAIKCLNCTNSGAIWCKCLYGSWLQDRITVLQRAGESTALMAWHKVTEREAEDWKYLLGFPWPWCRVGYEGNTKDE